MARTPGRIANCHRAALLPLFLILLQPLLLPSRAAAISTTVVVSQVYTAGGETGATWQNDYVVLFNLSAATVNLTGWTLQTKATLSPAWQAVPLCGSIGSGHFYLVQLAAGGPFGASLPLVDCGGALNLARSDFTVAVVNGSVPLSGPCLSSPTIVDLAGWGPGPACAEGTAINPTSDPAVAMVRTSPCVDSDNNSTNFGFGLANPQNSSATDPCVNQPPAIDPVPPLTVDETASLDQPVSATDPDGGIVTLSLAFQPSFVTLLIDPPSPPTPSTTTGNLRIQPGPNAAEGAPSKQWCFKVVATDDGVGGPASSQRDVCLTVNRTNSQPTFTQAPPLTIRMVTGEEALFSISAADLDTEQSLTFSLLNPPPFAVLTTDPTVPGGGATGQVRFRPGPNDAGTYCCSVRVQDSGVPPGSLTAPVCIDVITTAANIPYSGTWPGGVNSHTGELVLSHDHAVDVTGPHVYMNLSDVCLGGPLPLCFERYYASLLDREGADFGHLGTNWLGTYDWKVEVTPTTETIVDNRGERLVFGIVGGDRVQLNHLEEHNTLIIRAFDNMHRLHRAHQRRTYEFDGTTGLLQKILDEHGNSHTCSYTGSLLSSVSDGHGRMLSFTYGVDGKLSSTGDGTRTVSYGYSGNNLSSCTNAAGHTTTYAYATGPYPGLLTSATVSFGTDAYDWGWGANGSVASETDALGHTWAFGVGPGGGCIMSTPTGDTWTAVHDTGLRLLSLQDPLAGTTSWTYDASGRPASVTRPLGDVTTVAYDPASGFPSDVGRADGTHVTLAYGICDGLELWGWCPASVSYPDGTSEGFAYDAAGNLVTHTDQAGQTWTATYNANGQPLTQTNPAGGVTTFTYDPQLRLAVRADDVDNSQTFTYDNLDRLVTLTHADLTTRTYAYDGSNFLVAWTDEAGKVRSFAYDPNERLISRTDPLGHTVQYAYDAMNRVTGVTDALGHAATYAHDALGRLTSTTDRTSRTTMYAYDALSRLVTRTDPGNNATTFTYDANGRVITTSDPVGQERDLEFDVLDRLIRVADPDNVAGDWSATRSLMGRVTSLTAPLGHTESFTYDSRGLLTSFINVTSETQFPRTSLGEVGSIRDPNLKVWPFAYDPQGRLTSESDPLGRATSVTYDNRNRVSHVTTPVGSVDPTYDPVGNNLDCQWLDASGSLTLNYSHDDARRLTSGTGATFGYDAADRLTSSNGLTFTHDDEGRLTGETYAPGKTVTYAYNTRGLLSQVTDWLGGTTSFAYDAAGRLTGLTRPNGIVTTYQYDSADRLVQKVESSPGPLQTPLASISLTRDALGRPTSIDRRQPLMPGVTAPATTGFTYDDAGQINGLTWDPLGRLVSDGARTFEWDGASRLTHYAAGADSPRFTYDAFGRMLSRTLGASTEQYVWDYATRIPTLSVIDPGPPQLRYFVHTPSGVPLYSIDAAGARRFYHYDEAGNTIFLTNNAGSVETEYAYTPYGGVTAVGLTAGNPYTWGAAGGTIQLGSSGLFRLGAGIYDATTTRTISENSNDYQRMNQLPVHETLPSHDLIYQQLRPHQGDWVTDGTPIRANVQVEFALGIVNPGPPQTDRIDPYKTFAASVPGEPITEIGWEVRCANRGNRAVGTVSLLQQSRVAIAFQQGRLSFDFVGTKPGPIQGPSSYGPTFGSGHDMFLFTHLDRQLVSPVELLQVSAIRPHTLQQQGRVLLDLMSDKAIDDPLWNLARKPPNPNQDWITPYLGDVRLRIRMPTPFATYTGTSEVFFDDVYLIRTGP